MEELALNEIASSSVPQSTITDAVAAENGAGSSVLSFDGAEEENGLNGDNSEDQDEENASEADISSLEASSQVIIEYLPRIYTANMLLIALLLFGFIYTFLKRNFFSFD